ncbi:MAG: hypothetical protein BAJALOKI2v1_750008 [Promethearchaeota archaeon]|nr:MAG: hypothetical protein BAJALOKI2v1_750008 [Candidatus Lokiarchaeota archaeon]
MDFDVFIVFDNKCSKPGFLEGFGFSALIYNHITKNYLLFDTGDNGSKLLKNINKFDVSIDDIQTIIISHSHYDHAGGLKDLYYLRKDLNIYVPVKNEKSFKREFSKANIIGVDELTSIEKNVHSSGQFGEYTREQALFLETRSKGIIILSGCAHPGLEQFIVKAKELGDIKAVIGGFHGFNKYSYLEGIDIIAGCHCTQNISALKRNYPEEFKQVCVGTTLSF